jgi:carbonic anhydrase/acetyltransferase-like protein (isoleucine patch superfamily)
MNAVIMDDVVIGEDSIVAAAAFVKAGMQVPPRTLVMGAPARRAGADGARLPAARGAPESHRRLPQ